MKKITFTLALLIVSIFVSGQKPVADFEVLVNYSCHIASTEFKNLSTDADSFLWDTHGNGTYYNMFEPRGTNISGDRSWIVTLIAYGNGQSDTISKQIDVFQTKVNFEYEVSDQELFAPLEVSFTNLSELREEDTLSYLWDFGDGNTSNEENPVHIFNEPGTYSVQLKGFKSDSCTLRTDDFVVVKDTAQRDEFSFINSACYGESDDIPCDWEKHYRRSGDSLIIFGGYSGNCGTTKTATKSFNGDTLNIRTWECGPETTCSCIYCIEFAITGITQDSVVVVFNNDVLTPWFSEVEDLKTGSNEINIYPNPIKNELYIEGVDYLPGQFTYEIINPNGKIVHKGILNNQRNIDLHNVNAGLYIIRVFQKTDGKKYVSRFVKE